MPCTYFADRGARHKAKFAKPLADCPFIPRSNFRLIQGGKFVRGGNGVFNPGACPALVASFSQNISRSAGENRIGRKPFLYRGRGKSILTQSPERFGPRTF
jgi:hypothetical protein